MPPRRRPSRVGIWVFLGVLAVAAAVFFWMASARAIFGVAGLVAVAGIAVGVQGKRQRSRLCGLAAQREGESICQFAQSFDARTVDTWIIRAVYDTLQQELEHRHPAFPVRASDALDDLLMDSDDLDMAIVPEVARRAGRSLKGLEANPYYGKVRSVADLVMCFNSQAKLPAA